MGYTERYYKALEQACKEASSDYQHEKGFVAVVADAFRKGMAFQYKNGFILYSDDLLERELPKNGQLYVVITTSNQAHLCRCVVTDDATSRYIFSYHGDKGMKYYTFYIVGGGMLLDNIGAWQRFIITK